MYCGCIHLYIRMVYFNLDTVNRKDKKGKNIEHLRGPLVESIYMSPQDGTWPASAAHSTIMRVGDRSMFHGDEPAWQGWQEWNNSTYSGHVALKMRSKWISCRVRLGAPLCEPILAIGWLKRTIRGSFLSLAKWK